MKKLIFYGGLLSVSCTFSLLGMQKEIEKQKEIQKFDKEWKRTFYKTSFFGAEGMMVCATYYDQRRAILDKYDRKEADELPKRDSDYPPSGEKSSNALKEDIK
jgi:hypothetical protein